MNSSRFRLLAIVVFVAMILFFLTRVTLLWISWPQTELDPGSLLPVFGRPAL